MKELVIFIVAITVLFLFTGCGGGGEGVAKPPAPANFKAERVWVKSGNDFSQKTELSWDKVNDANSYKLYIQAENQTSPTLLTQVNSTTYTHTIPSSLYSFDIDYFVSAVINGVEGEKAKASASAPPPPAPF
ncbi:MAG: hypothetical protein QXT84_05645 [Candidatus Bathyarchaeia archaeon]